MSEKKLKTESANSPDLAVCIPIAILRFVCSFLDIIERAKNVERCCRALKAASRHRDSFAGALFNYEDIRERNSYGSEGLYSFCKRYDSPPLQKIGLRPFNSEENTCSDFALVIATFGSTLTTLQLAAPGVFVVGFLTKTPFLSQCERNTCSTSRQQNLS